MDDLVVSVCGVLDVACGVLDVIVVSDVSELACGVLDVAVIGAWLDDFGVVACGVVDDGVEDGGCKQSCGGSGKSVQFKCDGQSISAKT